MKFSILDSVKTNNFTDPKIEQKITTMWEKHSKDVKEIFEAGGIISCVYHDYQSNYKGDYIVSLCKENNVTGTFDTSGYNWKEYIVDNNDPFGINNTWKRIWSEEETNEIDRVYDFDFEQYKLDGEVRIFIAIL